MGSVAASRFDITATARDIVRSLAVRTEESAFLSVRRGDETVCLVREDGSFPIRSFVLSEGVRFPSASHRRGWRSSRSSHLRMWMPTSSATRNSSSGGEPPTPPLDCARASPTRRPGATRVNPA